MARKEKVIVRSGVIVASSREPPVPHLYLSMLRLLHPCMSVDPLEYAKETVVKKYTIRLGNITGRVLIGVGSRQHVVEHANTFEFLYDQDAPRSFVSDAINKVANVISKYDRCLVILGYAPLNAWIDVNTPCKHQRTATPYEMLPPARDISLCTPRGPNESIECSSMGSRVGLIAVATSKIFMYVLAGYGLALAPKG